MNLSFRLILALLLAAASLSAQNTTRWDLFTTLDWEGRQAMLNQTPTTPWEEDFLLKALDFDDAARIESGSDNEIAIKKAVAIRLIKLLTDLPSTKAAPAIARLPLQYRDPILRGESWVALAKLGDRTVISPLTRTLATLNDSSQRARGEEQQAFYAIQALGLLKASDAFRAVTAASLGWYSPASGVRALATKTLPLLVPDSSKSTLELLATDDDLTLKEGVFQRVLDQGDADYSASAAAAVLGSVVRNQSQDKADQDRTERLTLASLTGAQKTKTPPVLLVPSIKVLLTRGDNFQFMVQGIRLLGKISDPSALDLLSSTLTNYNARQKRGTNTSSDLALVKELFQALAATGKAAARAPLDEARFSDYTPALVRDATAALSALPRE